MADVGQANCKVIWDLLHPVEDGEPPEQTLAFLLAKCAHVHIKDGRPAKDPLVHDWVYTPVGAGALPIPQMVGLLMRNGYDGYFSLEWETKWRGELQELRLDPSDVPAEYARYMRSL